MRNKFPKGQAIVVEVVSPIGEPIQPDGVRSRFASVIWAMVRDILDCSNCIGTMCLIVTRPRYGRRWWGHLVSTRMTVVILDYSSVDFCEISVLVLHFGYFGHLVGWRCGWDALYRQRHDLVSSYYDCFSNLLFSTFQNKLIFRVVLSNYFNFH